MSLDDFDPHEVTAAEAFSDNQEFTEINSDTREFVADIILKLNYIESKMSNLITEYVNSDKRYFINHVLLNSLVVNFSSKYKVITYIIEEEKLDVPKDFNKAIKILMSKRNQVAHSDSISEPDIDVEVDVDGDREGPHFSLYNVFDYPTVSFFENGKVNYTSIKKIYDDFIKYFTIAEEQLNNIEKQITDKR